MKGVLTLVFVIVLVGVLLVYAAGTKTTVGAFSNATNSGIKSLFGPGKYATGKVA